MTTFACTQSLSNWLKLFKVSFRLRIHRDPAHECWDQRSRNPCLLPFIPFIGCKEWRGEDNCIFPNTPAIFFSETRFHCPGTHYLGYSGSLSSLGEGPVSSSQLGFHNKRTHSIFSLDFHGSTSEAPATRQALYRWIKLRHPKQSVFKTSRYILQTYAVLSPILPA